MSANEPARIHSTTLSGIVGKAKERISGCSLSAAARGGAGPEGVIIASRSGRDGSLCARAGLFALDVGIRELVVENNANDVIA